MTSKTQRALVVKEKGKVHVSSTKAYPVVGADEIIVNVKAITLNPTDWKHVDRLLEPDNSIGCDFAGDIVEIGSAAQNKGFKVGDAVAGFVRGGFVEKDNGAFQEYVKTLPELVWHKPASLPYEDAASMGGIALSTAVQALYYRLGLTKPWEQSSEPPAPILIWAGSTSVGLFALALAKLSNPNTPVITTASPHNHELVKSRGADVAFDYKDPDVSEKIKKWVEEKGYKEGVRKALDNISEQGSTKLIANAMPNGGEIIALLPVSPGEGESWPNGVNVTSILLYAALKPKNKQDFADIQEWNKHLPALISERGLGNAIPLTVSDKGLDGVSEGLDLLRAGKVSGGKLAYTF